jgi:predicted phosphodiesterase
VRYGVIADVHGNLHALEAAVARLRSDGVDRFLCAGDLVGYGPYPNQCVELVAGLEAVTVAGNHDLIAIGRLSDDDCIRLARETLAWTRRVLSDDARAFLSRLPRRVEIDDRLVMAHGSLDDPQRYIRHAPEAAEQLDRLGAGWPSSRLLILGHTHRARAWTAGGHTLPLRSNGSLPLPGVERRLLNPGAVGQSRERLARSRFMLLDLERRQATFYALPYDVRACRAALRQNGLPSDSHHLSPAKLAVGARRLRALARSHAHRARASRLV